jgi:hypothetical protein
LGAENKVAGLSTPSIKTIRYASVNIDCVFQSQRRRLSGQHCKDLKRGTICSYNETAALYISYIILKGFVMLA